MIKKDSKVISVLMVGRIIQQDQVFKLIEEVAAAFIQRGTTEFYLTDAKTRDKLTKGHAEYNCYVFVPKLHQGLIDYIVTIGGDGTILYAAKEFLGQVPPLISFQRGSLGFMCRFRLKDISNVIEKVVEHHYGIIEMPFETSKLMRLSANKWNFRDDKELPVVKVCINEVYISRKTQERVTLEIWVNNEYLTSTAGDGILISTSTGSTAYSLSAGGPILQNGVNGILVVPIAPNSLSFRPICFPSDSQIKLKLHRYSRSEAYVSYDGQTTENFGFDHQIVIKRAQHDIIFLEPKRDENTMPTWIQRLKGFLGWNEKYRAPSQEYVPEINTHVCKKECIEDD